MASAKLLLGDFQHIYLVSVLIQHFSAGQEWMHDVIEVNPCAADLGL